MIFPHKFWRSFWIACLSYFFRLQYVCFPVHLYIGLIPNSSGQLAKLVVYIIPLEQICIITKSFSLTEIEPHTITNQPEESKRKDSDKKEYKKSLACEGSPPLWPFCPYLHCISVFVVPCLCVTGCSDRTKDLGGHRAYWCVLTCLRIELTYQLSKFSFSRNFHVLLSW